MTPLRVVMVTQNFTPDPGGIETTMGGVADRVVFAGRVEEGLKAALYRRATLFAMPVRRDGASVEGFGLTYLEAAWHGLAALADRDGGAVDAVAEGETGLVCDGGDPDAVRDALAAMLGDATARATMGQAAAARVRRDFV